MSFNENICLVFEQLRAIRLFEAQQLRSQGDLKSADAAEWRAKAYAKIIPILRGYPKHIESGAEAKQIYGIGARIASRIDEIIRTGTLSELKEQTLGSTSSIEIISDEREQILQLFGSVHRVGRKTAEKWYNSGYRRLEDIPREVCTDAQWLALYFHSHLSQKIPRDEIQEAERILHGFLDPRGIFFQICGSYRRGRPLSGDIDILIIAKEGRDVLSETLQCPIFTHTLACGPKKFLGIGRIRELFRRIDVEVVQPDEYPFAVTYFTGSASFNVKMRDHCLNLGLRLNEKSLTDSQGKFYSVTSEEHLFAVLGLRYLTPEERDNY